MIETYRTNDRTYFSVDEVLNDSLPAGTLYISLYDVLYVKICPSTLVKINIEGGTMFKLLASNRAAGLKLRPAPAGFAVKITQDSWQDSTYDKVEK